ncbi:retrovirus-related pol polyprotein from transposon TNT 1-94 [Tanacetum coccineum]|uniref:Retrovirus-related pol polyprotein from transposon TNT 1-94 n=1 Tax=Tanacetum coccineum TaxID=301880 RepID=A0ABQ4XSV8_9ASTR
MVETNVPQLVDKKGVSYYAIAPRLVAGKFNKSKKRMLCYLTGIEPYYIQCIKDGPFQPKTAEGANKPEAQCCVTTTETWTDLVHIFEGPSDIKENRIMDLKLEYNTFRAKPSESISHAYTHYKTLLNELSNDGVKLSKHEINTLDLADIYERIFKKILMEVDERTGEEYLKDLEIEFHKRALLAGSKRLVAETFDWDEKEVSDDKEMTQVKVLMALADKELVVGKNNARNGEWINITMSKGASPSSEVMSLTYQEHSLRERPGEDHRTSDHKVYVVSLKNSKNYKAQPYKFASPSKQIPKAKAKLFPLCTYCGFNNHHPNECRMYPECKICGSESSVGVSCNTCGSTVHSTTNHSDFEHFKRGGKIQATKSKEPTKRYIWVYFPRKKSQAVDVIMSFIIMVENKNDVNVKQIRTDNGTEFRNSELESFCDEKGISQNFSSLYTPEQNGVAERKNKTLMEAARTMLNGSILSKQFWTEAVRIACYMYNRSIIVKRHDKTPYEIFRERFPDISYFMSLDVLWTSEQAVQNERNNSQPTEEHTWNNAETSVSITELSVPKLTQSLITHNASTISHHAPQERWSSDEHIKLVNIIGEPTEEVFEALKHPGWVDGIQEELNQNKKYELGTVTRNKARLVAQDYNQEEGIDYDETFSLVAKMEAISIFLASATYINFKVFQMDVKSAFLNGKLKEKVYVKQPPGFESSEFHKYVCKLDKVLYGLKQELRVWYETLSTFLIHNKFVKGRIDNTLFIYKTKGDVLLVQVYVDGIIFGLTNYKFCKQIEKLMTKKFEKSMMGELTYFLGFQIKQDDKGISIC